MIRLRTASRLHFGLFSLAAEDTYWPNSLDEPTLPARRFGGVGLMIEQPGLQLTLTPAESWSAEGPLAERALVFARRFCTSVAGERRTPVFRLVVEQAPPEHVGLGTGTQLGLAVAEGLAVAWGLSLSVAQRARSVGRGLRSALGVHGFVEGGFLVEAGKGQTEDVAPLVARVPFPEDWRVVLILPLQRSADSSAALGLHGLPESAAFAQLGDRLALPAQTDSLCRLVLLGMLPALHERDLKTFGEAVFDFNRRVGEAFASVQGGTYASEGIAELVAYLRQEKIQGVGQSSWGPTVFALVADQERAEHLRSVVQTRFGLAPREVLVTRAWNRGASVTR